jgi:hypothetical protein
MLKFVPVALLCLPSLCFGMARVSSQQAGRYANPYLRSMFTKFYPSQQKRAYSKRLTPSEPAAEAPRINRDELYNEKFALKNRWDQLMRDKFKQRDILHEAQAQLRKISLYERLTGKPSYFDNRRRKIALDTIQKAEKNMSAIDKHEARVFSYIDRITEKLEE